MSHNIHSGLKIIGPDGPEPNNLQNVSVDITYKINLT